MPKIEKWFIFKMNGRWCTVKHYTKEKAIEWARDMFRNWNRDMRDDPPYSASFEAACGIVAKALKR